MILFLLEFYFIVAEFFLIKTHWYYLLEFDYCRFSRYLFPKKEGWRYNVGLIEKA